MLQLRDGGEMKKKSKGHFITVIGIIMVVIGVVMLFDFMFLPTYNQYAYIGGTQAVEFSGLLLFFSGIIILLRRWIL